MDYAAWIARAEIFMSALRQLGGEFDSHEVSIDPPLKSRQLSQLQKELPRPIPSPILGWLRQGSGGFSMKYVWEMPKESLPRWQRLFRNSDYTWGGGSIARAEDLVEHFNDAHEFATADWCWLSEPDFAQDKKWWVETFPFLKMDNFDFLGLEGTSDDVEPRVIYLAHDGTSRPIAASFDAFLAAWETIGYLGPEVWKLEPFIDSKTGYLAPKGTKLKALRQVLGMR